MTSIKPNRCADRWGVQPDATAGTVTVVHLIDAGGYYSITAVSGEHARWLAQGLPDGAALFRDCPFNTERPRNRFVIVRIGQR